MASDKRTRHNLRSFVVALLLVVGALVTGSAALAGAQSKGAATGIASPPLLQVHRQAGQPTSHGASVGQSAALPAPQSPYTLLYDQYDNAGTNSVRSQDYEAFYDAFDCQAADDFLVPSGQNWEVTEVDVAGAYEGTGSAEAFNVYFYETTSTLPGTPVYTATNQSYTGSADFVISLSTPAVLNGAGHYWVSIQARMNFEGEGQWGWTERTVQSSNPAAWRNPRGGFGVCPDWGTVQSCIGFGPDLVFRLYGNVVVTSTPTSTTTPTGTDTPIATETATETGTSLPVSTSTATPTVVPTNTPVPPTSTPCPLQFNDVPSTDPFYTYIRCLACRGIISGYNDNTFRPENNITRGQICKMVSNAASFVDPIPSDRQTYTDVPPTNTFWLWIERLTYHNVMSGYNCGGAGEPCDAQQRPYFRWAANATRGQLAKIVANADSDQTVIPSTQQTFEDVSYTNTFWLWIERLAQRGVMGGYTCGTPPAGQCVPPQNRPYFLPFNNVTRGQASKIVANTFYPKCQTPAHR